MANILNVYYYKSEYPLRATSADHLYCFRRYAGHNCFYLNAGVRGLPPYLRRVRFDVIVFHTLFLSARWDRPAFARLMRKVRPLTESAAVKVAMPQDEFLNTDLLCEFINEFGVDYVFSVAEESEWGKIYPGVDRRRVKFVTTLTGYLDEATVSKIDRLAAATKARPIDIGYRAWRGAAWLGRHGFMKAQIADVFEEHAPQAGLVADISTRAGDTLLGDAWYEFMLRAKYMIGVEGGASLLDRDGAIRERTEAYTRAHPAADFDEIEANCFPGLDGSLAFFPISPRHLEACATRTCQVLVEGSYSGVLEAGRHYIELKRDFSNIQQVLALIKEDRLRAGITERAYGEIVGSGRYTYRKFVEEALALLLAGAAGASAAARPGLSERAAYQWTRLADRLSWVFVMLHWYTVVPAKRQIRQKLSNLFSERTVSMLSRAIKGNSGV